MNRPRPGIIISARAKCRLATPLIKMAVTTQPRSNRKEAEQFVKDLDPQIVLGALFVL